MKRRAIGYLVASHNNGLQRWCKSDLSVVPWTLFTSATRPTIFPDLHAARVAIREAAKYWSAFGRKYKKFKTIKRGTPKEERRNYYVIRAESPYLPEVA